MSIQTLRSEYHQRICSQILGLRDGSPNNADKGSSTSRQLAVGIIDRLPYPLCPAPPSGQTAGTLFEQLTRDFLKNAFSFLCHLRPGEWEFLVAGEQDTGPVDIAHFEQYEHLVTFARALQEHRELLSTLGLDYLVKPDIVIARRPVPDAIINQHQVVLEENPPVAAYTPLRKGNRPEGTMILHASISCKWTIRSDRAQNIRTEALNLIRNRKGHTPHIVSVTAEPMPTRIASLALGTGDIDCVYHFALPELWEATEALGNEDQLDMLRTLVEGRRLRDISDLPFDLVT